MKQAKKCGFEDFILSKLFQNFQGGLKLSQKLKLYEILIRGVTIVRPFAIYLFCIWNYIGRGYPFKLYEGVPLILALEIGQSTINDAVRVLQGINPTFRALRELKEFMIHLDEPLENYTRSDIPSEKAAISITEGSFSWENHAEINKPGPKPTLKNISISIKHGSLVGIIGDSGSGKSSLFYAILGAMNILSTHETKISVSGTVGYVNQNPTFQSCSIRDYILQGRPYDSPRFKRVIRGTTLNQDIVNLPKGYETDIGETGFALTTMQKVKIALAQVAYKNADIVLLDGVLDLFEGNDYKKFLEECILDLFREKTRVIISKDPSKWSNMEYFYILLDGFIVHRGPYEVINKYKSFKELEQKLQKSTNFAKDKVPNIDEHEVIPRNFEEIFEEHEEMRSPEFLDSSRVTNRNDMSIISDSGIELMPLNRNSPVETSIPLQSPPLAFKFSPEDDHEDIMRGENRFLTLVKFLGGWQIFSILLGKIVLIK